MKKKTTKKKAVKKKVNHEALLDIAVGKIEKLEIALSEARTKIEELEITLYDAQKVIEKQERERREVACKFEVKNSFLLYFNESGELLTIGMKPFEGFLKVSVGKELSLFEAATLIEDAATMNSATDAIGKANLQDDKVMINRLKTRTIEVLKQQIEKEERV